MKIAIAKSLREGVEIIKKNPIIFIPVVCATIISFFINFYLNTLVENAIIIMNYLTGEEIDLGLIFSSLPIFKIIIFGLLGGLISFYLFLAAIKLIYDSREGKPSLTRAFATAFKKYIPVLLAGALFCLLISVVIFATAIISVVISVLGISEIIKTTLVLLAFLLCAGILVFTQIKFLYYPYAGIIDDKGTIDSLKMSWWITERNFWPTLALTLITMIVALILLLVITPLPQIIESIVGIVIQTLTTAWAVSVFTSAYLQIRR